VCEPAKIAPDPKFELHKLQFDYAWKWFSFHAEQRTKVFNFMLIVFGIFLAGIVNALNKTSELPRRDVAILCFIAAGLALIFGLLDRRNRDLLWLGEEVLMHLERESIFHTNGTFTDRHGETRSFGILWRQALEEKKAREEKERKWSGKPCVPLFMVVRDAWLGKHRLWFPAVSLLIAFLFATAGIVILFWPSFLINTP
jgi:hypothetical protein